MQSKISSIQWDLYDLIRYCASTDFPDLEITMSDESLFKMEDTDLLKYPKRCIELSKSNDPDGAKKVNVRFEILGKDSSDNIYSLFHFQWCHHCNSDFEAVLCFDIVNKNLVRFNEVWLKETK